MRTKLPRIFLGALLGALASQTGHAAMIIIAEETGGDVVFTYSGDVDITGATAEGPASAIAFAGVIPNISVLGNTDGASDIDAYNLSGPTSIGSGTQTNASSFTGNLFVVQMNLTQVRLADGYVDETFISGSFTFTGTDLATLGIDDSTDYVWTVIGSGDTITLTFLVPPVPEPSTLTFTALGLVGMGWLGRPRRKR